MAAPLLPTHLQILSGPISINTTFNSAWTTTSAMDARTRRRLSFLIALLAIATPQQWCPTSDPSQVDEPAKFTFVLSDESTIQTTYSFLSNANLGDCHFLSLVLEDVSVSGSLISDSQAARAPRPVGSVNWEVGPDGGPSSLCSNRFTAEFLIARKSYTLEGEVAGTIQPWNSLEGLSAASGTWTRSVDGRSGTFKFFDYGK